MVQITVTDELAQAIADAGPLVTLVDSRGRTVGQITPIRSETAVPPGTTDEHWAEIKRRMADFRMGIFISSPVKPISPLFQRKSRYNLRF